MPPALRQRKRPASPDAEPDPPKKTKQSRSKAVKGDPDSGSEGVKSKQLPAKPKGKSKAKAIKSEPEDDEEEEVDVSAPKANGKAKSKSEPKNAIPENATTGDAQFAKAEKLVIPVDEDCSYNGRVYVDDSTGIIYVGDLLVQPPIKADSRRMPRSIRRMPVPTPTSSTKFR